ncbi:DUF4129 domain-containing protein [Arthrobacter sp. Z4-13]
MAAEPPVLPDAAEARRWATEELAKSEYRGAEPSWLDSLWRSFLDWLLSLDGPSGGPGPVPGPVIGIVIAVIIAIAVILARPRLNPKARQGKEVFEPDSELTAADYRQRAEASAAAGKWGDAVVDRFRALVRSAEDRTVLDPQPGRTADEVVLALSIPFPPEAARLDQAARTFDAVHYGNWTAGSPDYQAIAALDQDLEAARPARRIGRQDDFSQQNPAAVP